MTNPYTSPETTHESDLPRIAWPLRLFSWLAFACGFVAFMARLGYTGWMDATWIFGILPTLATLSIVSAMIALAWPWQPSERQKVAWPMVLLGVFFLAVSSILPITFHEFPILYQIFHWQGLHFGPALAATISALLTATKLHGTIRGRRLACVGFGLAILQCSISVIDIFIAEYAP